MKEIKKALVITLAGVVVFGSLLAREYINYCNQTEYFFVADSIVFPAGQNFDEALRMARSTGMYADGERWEKSTFIGLKSRCENLQVW